MLDTKYNHIEVEKNKYEQWKQKNYFLAGDLKKKPYCIVIPPPNVTGKLHLGHAWDTTLQDILIRYKRMDGYDTLWLPGMDHAAIATEVKVVNKLKKEGIDKYELGREGFLKKAWEWKGEYAQNIRMQWAKLGLSLDYSKERFTLDDGLSEAVKHVFIKLYEKGYIYRGERIINWDPISKTALSNEEVIYKEVEGAFYHIKYYLEDEKNYLDVATTRPETLFGDTAVAVNPSDERYMHLIGKKVKLPIVNKWIPIIGDEHADPEFGTGVVKITPAHDPNDFEVGNRHHLERILVMNPDATMNYNALHYEGMDRYACRESLLDELKEKDLLICIESMHHSVGHSERTDVMVEPYLSKQWFVKMDVLAKQVLENQKTNKKVHFIPERFEKILNHWMEDCHDWCISRQLWWGHRIPAFYKDDQVYVGYEAPKEDGWKQDEDVLDTWFSSALWPFSTLGWPEETELMKRYYPTDVLVTGYDIIFFWVCRMVFQGLEFTKERPFKDVLIHGLVRDKQGRKMSKSLGNGVDPMDIIDQYGCDALRFFLATSSAPGMDLRYDEEKVKSTWNFINKLWNASRYVLLKLENFDQTKQTLTNLTICDKWILTKMNDVVKKVRKHMDQYEFNVVGSEIYNFVWNDFCDWYIELSKLEINDTTKTVLWIVLETILKLLHPFTPYVTEEIYLRLPNHDESIMMSAYPQMNLKYRYQEESKILDSMIDFVGKVRTYQLENQVPKDSKVYYKGDPLILKILKIKEEQLIKEKPDFQKTQLTGVKSENYEIIFLFDNTKNMNQEKERIEKEIEKLSQNILRRKTLLENKNYISKAPSHLVEKEHETYEQEKKQLEILSNQLKSLQ